MKKRFLESGPNIFIPVCLLVFFLSSVSFAQTEAVTSSVGDQSLGSLGWAVTEINNLNGGAISIDSSVTQPVTQIVLTQPLPVFSQSVTFQGDDLNLVAQNDAQAQLVFQSYPYALVQQNNITFQNDGALGGGLDISVSIANGSNWIDNSNTNTNILAGNATPVTGAGGAGLTGQNGGSVSVSVPYWTTSGNVTLAAGSGGGVTDSGGVGDLGGQGGLVVLTGSSLEVGNDFLAAGGNGGSVTDSTGTNTGGMGGSASVSYVSISNGLSGGLTVVGGNGGSGVTGGLGGSATVLTESMFLSSNFDLQGGSGGAGNSVCGNGGNAFLSVGNNFNAGGPFYLNGGNGGSVTDTNGISVMGGQGGSVMANGTSVSMFGPVFQLEGGTGGSVTDLGSGTNSGGSGGSVSASFDSILIGPGTIFTLNGGNGGEGVTGGAGGAATLLSSSVSQEQGLYVYGGLGGNGVTIGGNGGDAFVSVGSMVYNGANLIIAGGNGGGGSVGGGNGGNAAYMGGTISVNSNLDFQLTGGNGNEGGNGGSASVSLAGLTLGSNFSLEMIGGNGGAGVSGATSGTGGRGGDTVFDLGNLVISGSGNLNFNSGSGGTGGNGNTGVTAGNGGAGGDLGVTIGTLSMGVSLNFSLTGGTGGNGGTVFSGGTGGNGGDGGNASLVVGAVTMSSANQIHVNGGNGGFGGAGAVTGSNGAEGQAFVSIGDLEGTGEIFLTGANGVLALNQGSYSGEIVMNGPLNLEKIGSGSLTLSGENHFGGGTSVVGGGLYMDTGGTLGTGGVQVGSGALLDYIDSAVAVNAVTVGNGGTLQFQNSSSAGLASVTLQSGGAASFTGAATGGIATFENSAGSTLDLSGSTAGGVTIGWLSGAGLVNMGSNNFGVGLVGASTTFSGAISGTGTFDMEGGDFTLLSNSPYTGGTHIDAGILSVGATQALGTGSVAVNGGILAIDPGSSPLTLKIGGNYSQGAGGTLELNVGGADMASSDFISVGGSSSLSGALSLATGSGLTAPIGSSTAIMGAASNSGLFLGVEENFSGIRLLPVYSSSAVSLLSIIPSFEALGLTPNEKALGADMDAVALNPRVDSLMASIGVLSNSRMQGAFSQLSPEDLTGLYQAGFEAAQARASLVEDRLSQLMVDVDNTVWMPGFSDSKTPWFAANMSPSQEVALSLQKTSPWGGFLSTNGGFFNVAADKNAAGYQVSNFGLTGAGLDYRLSRQASAGLLVGYGHTGVTLGTGGTATADGGEVGLYGLFYSDGFFASALAEGGINTYGTQRAGYNGTANGKTQGQEYDGALEMGYQFKQDQVKLGPFGSAQFASVGLNGFTETGSQAPLTLPNQSLDSFLTRLGLRADGQWQLAAKTFLNPSVELAWEHEYDNQGGNLTAGFGTGDSFTVSGPQVGQDGLLAGVGVDLTWLKGMSLSLRYQGELGRTNLTSNQVSAGVKFGF